MTEEAQKLSVNPLVVIRETGTGSVLVDVTTGDCYELNTVGAAIWTRLARAEGEGAIASALSAEYGIPVERAAADVHALMTDLTRHGLLISAGR